MSRDYKYRAQDPRESARSRRPRQKDGLALWRWMLITSLIIGFVVFLFYLVSKGAQNGTPLQAGNPSVTENTASGSTAKPEGKSTLKVEAVPEPKGPQFDFYTYLPKKEIVVPDHEINTRMREERVGKAKAARYILQVGSYKDTAEADRLRAKLALMGIESRIERTKVGNVTWHRVTLGPYTRMASVGVIRSRLRQNGIDTIVAEYGQ
ncbi:SPOR domain-containing protein [Methylomicrobium sp. RS1]|jgi:cell division protein FtsN|uniref:SPOR domain-containing protein n=1 Tax=Candidatus Methylomicrobium oryzae TaxID=2802053 RepID=UPI001920C82F|nr:SPOR domain-containing protein [Methylomicrobium sp. RS1]MBL1262122.1 SPOR domain-containing protein [Methylomicrobium sp. RS1]